MANWHALTQEGGIVLVVMHFDVPAGINSVGIPWSTALKHSGIFSKGTTVLPASETPDGSDGGILPAELAQIQAYTRFEYQARYKAQQNMSPAQHVAQLNALWTELKRIQIADVLKRTLDYYGASG